MAEGFVKDFVWLESRDREIVRAVRWGGVPTGSLMDRVEQWSEWDRNERILIDSGIGDIDSLVQPRSGYDLETVRITFLSDYASMTSLLTHPIVTDGYGMVELWRHHFEELLTPPVLLSFLSRMAQFEAGRSGIERCERLWDLLKEAREQEDALYLWNASRLAWACGTVQSGIDGRLAAMAEFLMDYLLWQRAIALDVSWFEDAAGPKDHLAPLDLGNVLCQIEAWDATFCDNELAMRRVIEGWRWPEGMMTALRERWATERAKRTDYRKESLLRAQGRIEIE